MSNLSLLSVYDEMLKQANSQEAEKIAAENAPEAEGFTEEEILSKYAEAAEGALQEAYGQDYTVEDVQALAERMIMKDEELLKQAEAVEVEEAMQKVAEAHELGTIIADAFLARLAEAQQ